MSSLPSSSDWRSWHADDKQALLTRLQRIKHRRRQHAYGPFRVFGYTYRHNPARFAQECIAWPAGKALAPYQAAILQELLPARRVAVRGPHGLGKSATAALAILHFALTREALGVDWKIPTTASAWRQLTHYLWPEIKKWARLLQWEKIGREPFNERTELLALNLKLTHGEAFAVASDNAALIEGAHADEILYVYDEAKAIPDPTWDSIEGAFSTGTAYALAISTPGAPSGRFYEIHRRAPGFEDWHVRHVTRDAAITAGRMQADWAEQRKKQWGASSAVYNNRVCGEFWANEADALIPLAWVEAANLRWLDWHDRHEELGRLTAIGVDVARSGPDLTVLALRKGPVLVELRKFAKEDTMATVGRVVGIQAAHGGTAIVDVIGLGAGVVDRLREQGAAVQPFNASEHTDTRDRSGELGFFNKRSAAWWHMRELLDPLYGAQIALPPDDVLIGDLTEPTYKVLSGGKYRVESKNVAFDETTPTLQERLGRSPDEGDAVVMSFWEERPTTFPVQRTVLKGF